ncbi:MAG: zinc ribbon domain-containing protein [Chloroflexi bacterium]|nr:zinc ribbon domain-containing protein [Chloroflexota bacterium]
MSLIECPECGQQISDQAASCPACGYPLDNVAAVPQPEEPPVPSAPAKVQQVEAKNSNDVYGKINPEWAKLYQERGEQFWRDELQKAKNAAIVYGVIVIATFALVFFVGNEIIFFLAWLMLAGGTIYAGASQVQLLPFMDAKLVSHWVTVSILALTGCAGLLWLFLFIYYNSKAEKNLKLLFDAVRTSPEGTAGDETSQDTAEREESQSKGTKGAKPPVAEGADDSEGVAQHNWSIMAPEDALPDLKRWLHTVDLYLLEANLSTRTGHFATPALWHGFVSNTEPEQFVRHGYNQGSEVPPWAQEFLETRAN